MKYEVGFEFEKENIKHKVIYRTKIGKYIVVTSDESWAHCFTEADIDDCVPKKTVKYEAFEHVDGELVLYKSGTKWHRSALIRPEHYKRMPAFDLENHITFTELDDE